MKTWLGLQLLGLLVGIAAYNLQGMAQAVVLAGAAVAAAGIIHAKVVMPGWHFSRRFARGVDVMLDNPSRFESIEERLERGDARMQRIELALYELAGRARAQDELPARRARADGRAPE